jgi:TolB-like protein
MVPEKSIAVLPFENLSDDKQNAFFADGVQDEILTNLAKVADLKVISRTSVAQYKAEAARNLQDIGRALGVAHVLEGSVQRVANKVRVNAQLIDARNDAHLWAQTYTRDLADVFGIQSEIAEAIAQQLQAHLSANEKAQMTKPVTMDPVATIFICEPGSWMTCPMILMQRAACFRGSVCWKKPCVAIRNSSVRTVSCAKRTSISTGQGLTIPISVVKWHTLRCKRPKRFSRTPVKSTG